MGFLESVYKIEPQLSGQWELTFDDPTSSDLVYKVQDVSLPFYKLTVETKFTGQKVYKGLEEPSEVGITLREDINFNTYKFFNTWFSSVFDFTTRTFRTHATKNEVLKNATLKFFKLNFTALNVPYTGSMPFDIIPGFEIQKPSYGFYLKDCKILGVDNLSLSYDGNPLLFSVNLIPEEIQFLSY